MNIERPELIWRTKTQRNRREIIKAIIVCIITVAAVVVLAMAPRAEERVEVGIAPPESNTQPNAFNALNALDIVENPYQTIQISAEEYNELRWVLALEAQTQGIKGEEACCEVIFNRYLSQKSNWGQAKGIHGVLSMRGQFSTYKHIGKKSAWAVPGKMEDEAISETLRNGCAILPRMSYVYFDSKGGVNGRNIIKMGGHYFGEE